MIFSSWDAKKKTFNTIPKIETWPESSLPAVRLNSPAYGMPLSIAAALVADNGTPAPDASPVRSDVVVELAANANTGVSSRAIKVPRVTFFQKHRGGHSGESL